MQSWIQTNIRLGDVLSKVVDNRGKTPKWGKDGYDLIETTSIVGNNKYPDFSLITKRVSRDTFETWFRSGHPIKGDILFATVGANIGNISIMKETRGCIAQNLVALRPNKEIIDADFLYYFLSWNRTQRILRNLDIGAAQPSIKVPHLLEFKIPTPPLSIQRRIAAILAAYDDLIENNTRRIHILEEMAQRIYEEWFVRFRFPGHENVTMVETEFGLIPAGWEVQCVTQMIKFDPRTTVPREGLKPFVPMSSLAENSMLIANIESREGNSGSRFKNGDTLFARITPCLENGKTGFVDFLPDDNAVAFGSTEFIVLRSTTVTPEFVYLTARSERFRQHAIKSMSGATGRQRVRVDSFNEYLLSQPDNDTLNKFTALVAPVFKTIGCFAKKNANLRRTRDLLLPKLISGEIDVSDFPGSVTD